MYFEIGYQLATSNFDFYAGGGFREPEKKVDGKKVDLLKLAKDNGFYVLDDLEDFKKMNKMKKKVLMFAPRMASGASLPYAIDAGPGDATLLDYTAKGIELLEGDEGFFMMVEGGKIDWACHANDAATTVHEVIAFDEAIAVALDFYYQHPDETIIVVTADHETGGLSLGRREMGYESNPGLLQYQKSSIENLSQLFGAMREKQYGKEDQDFAVLLELLENNVGLNSEANGTLLTEEEKEMLKEIMVESIYNSDVVEGEYSIEPLAVAALDLLSMKAGIAWGSGSHTYMTVPVFAIGAGAEAFSGVYDNTELPKKLEALMGIE
jgi:alkaline phosphatase